MKSKLQFAALIATFFALQMNAQDKTTVNAMNSEISDNLDLRAVSSIFGESQNLKDFERRLNDPRTKISNLDLNDDNMVDYLRVIESVENRTHVIIIQSVIGRDLYQDVATIELEKDRQNNISIQIVGNTYMYGQNYIYEPEYRSTPQIYASFWINSYQPYYSSWTWNYYPTYYASWNPFPLYRYRSNIYGCVNYYNNYNYVNYRRCNRANVIYKSYSCNSYERQYPNYAFSRRNNRVSNRYELDQRRYSSDNRSKNEIAYSRNNSSYSRNNNYNNNSQREYTQNRTTNPREYSTQRTEPQRDYSQNRTSNTKENNTPITQPQRDYSQNRTSAPREYNTQRVENQRDYSQNRTNAPKEYNTQRAESQRDYSQNRTSTSRENNSQRAESQRSTDNASRSSNRRI